MQKILTSSKAGFKATQERPTEKSNYTTIFSRGADACRKSYFSLKNFFYRTDMSPAKAAVEKAIPQVTTESIKTENKKNINLGFDERTRLRMAYRDFLIANPKEFDSKEVSSKFKEGHEEKVSFFDSAVCKLVASRRLNHRDKQELEVTLTKLEAAIQENEGLGESEKIQLLFDCLKIRMRVANQIVDSTEETAYPGS